MEKPTFSNGWLHRFQARRTIKWREQHGEAGGVPEQAEQEMVMIRQALGAYSLKDQFNCDETALLWKQTPARSLSTRQLPGRKRRKQGSLLYSAAMQMSLRNWNHGLLELLGIHMLLELQA
ncbi:uncharacterized protein EURHEDRAFT_113016 [Aspergillus ruber CBS 135680]|uniref:HTH CENPB-type domain-containing protein n=1 Tax=Aspergillus ruber (strain CBS 135680) TaxID=1388766 RepID=A0A017SAA7_ASPRC|nr:uncharacterized protein EURHEDRAFT_113016 [Aspergillus ruber CBS 135680]EYE93882.1 hypothetical protein EURHEDRAFT_113016 [Aspergillus ruber CBS 135680]